MATNNMNQRSAKASGAKSITGANRPTMGTSAYGPVDGPRTGDFRAGFLEAKVGEAKGDPIIGTKANRGQVMQETLGASYRVQVKNPGPPADPRTQTNTRYVPAVMGNRDAFWAHG